MDAVLEGLKDVRAGLNADGYDIELVEDTEPLTLRIVADPTSCSDCLVPKTVMAQIVGSVLGLPPEDVRLIYPVDAP